MSGPCFALTDQCIGSRYKRHPSKFTISCGRPELCRHVRAGKRRCYLLHKAPSSRLHIAVDRKAHRVHGDPSDLRAKRMRQPTRVDEHPSPGSHRDCISDDLGDIIRGAVSVILYMVSMTERQVPESASWRVR